MPMRSRHSSRKSVALSTSRRVPVCAVLDNTSGSIIDAKAIQQQLNLCPSKLQMRSNLASLEASTVRFVAHAQETTRALRSEGVADAIEIKYETKRVPHFGSHAHVIAGLRRSVPQVMSDSVADALLLPLKWLRQCF